MTGGRGLAHHASMPCEHVSRRGRALGMKLLWRPEHRYPVTALTQSLVKSKQSQRQIDYGVTEVITLCVLHVTKE